MDRETQTTRRFPLASRPSAPEVTVRPGSPTPSSPGGRYSSKAVAVLSAIATMPVRRHPKSSSQPPKPPKIMSYDKAFKEYGKSLPNVIHTLEPDTIRSLPTELLNSLPGDRLGYLPDDVLVRVSPSVLAKAGTNVLMRLPIQTLVSLPTDKLLRMDTAKLAQTDPRWLADLLREVPGTSRKLLADQHIFGRLAQLPPEDFMRLPHQALERVSTEYFRRMPIYVWAAISPERLISFPDNVRAAYPKGVPGRIDTQGDFGGNSEHSLSKPVIRAVSPPSSEPTSLPWSPEPLTAQSQQTRSWIPSLDPIAPLAPFLPPASKPAAPLPPAMPDIKADIVNSVNGIRIEDLKSERDQLKYELRTEREQLNRQLGSLQAEKAYLASTMAQLEKEKQTTAETIRNYLSDKDLGNIKRGQDGVQLLLEYSNARNRYAKDLEQKAVWWQGENQNLHNQWAVESGEKQEALRRLHGMEQENARIRQELRDQRANLETVEAQRLEIARLQTSLSRAEATVEAELENQHAKLTEHYTSQQSRLDEELRQLKLDKLSLEQEIDTLGQRWQNEQQALVNNYDAQLQAQEAAYQAQFQSLQQQLHQHYQAQVEDAGRLCDQSLRERDELHRQHTSELLERITSLESSLVDNSDDFRPATDDSLRNKYQSLKLTIDTITFNLGTITFRRGTTLDPGGFLEREGKGEEVYLLRSIFWERLQQGFFSLPFGLGALGSGDGKKKLLDMYVAYRRLSGIEPPLAVPQSVEQDCLTVFRTDKDANKWRSSAFQTIGSAVISKKGKPTAELDKEKHAPYFQNRDQVLNSIKEVLGEVCGGVSEDMEDAVTNLVHNAAELAVELGAQRAELGFESPLWGSSVQIGRGFIDCIDDDTYRDELKTVALAVSPKFYKTGDGRHDLTTTKLISQGTIFSARD